MVDESRRSFLAGCSAALGGLCLAAYGFGSTRTQTPTDWARPAKYFDKLEGKRVECTLCPQKCRVADQERGTCGVRENRGGDYFTLVHSRVCTHHTDPIEKKPLFHFLPGTNAFSIATAGCNMSCRFCQNWNISQFRPEQVTGLHLPPGEIASMAKASGCPSIAYTYTEPVIFTEYMLDSAEAGNKLDLRSVMISNGYIQEKPLKDLCSVLGAIKVDLKAYTETFYKDQCGAALKPVLEALTTIRKSGVWLEVVVLVIPTLNDSKEELSGLSKWLYANLGSGVPVHFTRFSPANSYLLKNLPPTPVSTLEKARDIAMEAGLHYVYVGNVWGHPGENTYCPSCRKPVIVRRGFTIFKNELSSGKCRSCGHAIQGVWG